MTAQTILGRIFRSVWVERPPGRGAVNCRPSLATAGTPPEPDSGFRGRAPDPDAAPRTASRARRFRFRWNQLVTDGHTVAAAARIAAPETRSRRRHPVFNPPVVALRLTVPALIAAAMLLGAGEPVRAFPARKRALALSVGNAPRTAEGRSGAPLFRDFVQDEWLPAYRRRCAPSSCQFANRVLKGQLIPAFGRLPLDAIRRTDVERWFDTYSRTAPGGANKALGVLGQIMNAAFAAGHAGTAPVKGIAKNPRPKLTRFLSAEEIERLHRVLDRLVRERPSRRQQADIIRLLLLTGCRRGEILKLHWSEVDGDRLNLADSKTGPRRVWLSQAAQAILARQPRAASPYVFPSPRHPDKSLSHALCLWHRARKEAGLDDVRLHDLRHTVASQAVARGVPLSTVARMLGHADPRMTLRYAHVGDRDLQAAAERIGKAIEAAMETGESPAAESS